MVKTKIKSKDIKYISELMEKGIQREEHTGLKYYTGYEYKSLYDWDQYFEAILQLYMGWDTTYIKNGIIIFLDNQQKNGFIARTVPIRPVELEGSEHVKPFLAQISLLCYKKDGNLDFLTENYYKKMKKYLLYWLTELNNEKTGLSVWNSAPHTGMDNQHERAGWWMDCFSQGIDLNSFLYRECLAFSEIAHNKDMGEDTLYFADKAKALKKAVNEYLWDENTGFYYDRNVKTEELLFYKSSAAFSPLWAGIASKEQARRIVYDHLLNPKEFWRPFPIPSYAADEKGYNEGYLPGDLGCGWRANTWIPVNYYTAIGLRKYGYIDISSYLAYISYRNVKTLGSHEYYTSESVLGCGLDPFWGWSLLAFFMPTESELNLDPTVI
ncbi:MAG: hypothetical protein LBI03_07760 [Clostridiales bacterium]|nr:hypothetical protein [Clostridiales bacterium]